ncbi:MAG: phosphatase domain-containing protein [Pseudomonadota bacterium]
MKSVLVLIMGLCVAGCGDKPTASQPPLVSDIKDDETVVFFNTSGWLDEEENVWQLPIHGWIYEPEDSTARKAAFRVVLEEQFDLTTAQNQENNLTERLNLLIADNERGKTIVIRIGDRVIALPKSAENGHFQETISLSVEDVEKNADDGIVRFSAVTEAGEERAFKGQIRLDTPTGLSVISDIDDTVKISHVTDKRRLMEQTFLRDFEAASGMSQLYQVLADSGVAFHYVSSSPWQLYQPLDEFLEQSGFPWATFSLKAVRFRDETLLSLFKKGTETKPKAITAILDRYPNRQFILVGDSGEQDPEVYAKLLRERPNQVIRVLIRNVTQEKSDNQRFMDLFAELDQGRWQLFDHPKGIVGYVTH